MSRRRCHPISTGLNAALCALSLLGIRDAQGQETDRSPASEHANRVDRDTRDVDRLGWYVPDFFKLQTGGFAGLFTVGTGYAAFEDILNVSLFYGYVPEWHAEENVHSLHLTLAVRPFDFAVYDFRIVPIYLGGGLLHTWGDDYFVDLPNQYSSGYYPPTGLHWTAHIGTELDFLPAGDSFFERHGLYAEVTTVDTFVFGYFENRETVSVIDAVGLGLGYRAAF